MSYAVQLTNKDREQLCSTIQALMVACQGMAQFGSQEEELERKKAMLHHGRVLDILYPNTVPLIPAVPIESLAPEAALLLSSLARAEGYGPPSFYEHNTQFKAYLYGMEKVSDEPEEGHDYTRKGE